MHAAFLCDNPAQIDRVYGQGRRERLAAMVSLRPEVLTGAGLTRTTEGLRELEVLFSTWGMPCLTAAQLDDMPRLRGVFYAAGSVRAFAAPLLERGITLVSAWAANAVPVAEFTLAQILLATKGYFRNVRDCKDPQRFLRGDCFTGPGNFGETVALIGAGQVGRLLIRLLKPFNLRVLVVDPYLSDADASALGVERVALEEAFQRALVVSNHLPNIPDTVGLLKRGHFESMRPGAVFINTGRGAQVVEPDLQAVLATRTDLTALLDVTSPEPPPANSAFYALPNVFLSSHIAGSLGDEVVRMADYMLEEFERWTTDQPLRYGVTAAMLATMA